MAVPKSEPVAIVGSACRFPGGATSPSKLWQLLEKPRDLCQEIPPDRFNPAGFYHPDGSHHGTTNVRHSYLLEEDIRVFDAAFFNISPNEADSIDPQQRLLMETVYETLERGGHTLDALRDSDTAVFTGTMSVDYNDTGLRDFNTLPTYFSTGINRSIISNRISYVFDWHGPSINIDTACSSSLIAVHEGVKAVRTGESRVAVACGTQIILNPDTFVLESKLSMLSPTGRSRMWDADADGYARGEGIAVVVLKRLSDAIADGDHIESIIRETGVNQDGHTSGLTVPSTDAQAALIRKTYANAGLDPENNPEDRPQYFEAHGTGTKAGDPKEATAIHQSFGRHVTSGEDPLYVGSVKTIIGHLEGTAGLAGLLKGSASIQNGYIPPNLLFNRLNPAIEPIYKGLQVPTRPVSWPILPDGVPRRVSVNSFGFGGTNAHAILEQYHKDAPNKAIECVGKSQSFTPFMFSAASEVSLQGQLQAYSDYLKSHKEINATDLAWTLRARRTQFSTKAAFSALSIEQLASKIDAKLATTKQTPGSTIGIRTSTKSATTGPHILGVFTGQGAQWAGMGGQLIKSSEFALRRIEELDNSLATLPSSDRPEWRIHDEILADAETSRIAEAELSQPLCTAIQIVLVDILHAAGVSFSAVVGHSSGEIGAAYAAGFLSGHDAIRIAYYRGLHARVIGNNSNAEKGAMLAAGLSWEEADEIINLPALKGRLAIAAHNSPASVTLSGDASAIRETKEMLDEQKKFARLLKVDTAYHSHHMLPCGDPYVNSMKACGVQINQDKDKKCAWFSTVTASDRPMQPIEELQDVYWRDNMTSSVLFAEGIQNAIAADDQIGIALEIGPHPALKGPVAQNIADMRPNAVPYSGVLVRGQNDIEAFSDALGFLWTQLGPQGIDLQSCQDALSYGPQQPQLVVGLPSYQWDHGRAYWSESRRSRKLCERETPSHEILGVLLPESNPHDLRWTNILKTSEIPWLDGHKLQGQTVFPAAGYAAMALEGSKHLAANRSVETFELHELNLPKAITFDEDNNSGIETLVTLTKVRYHQDETCTADFSCYSGPVVSSGSKQDLELTATATVEIFFGTPSFEALSCTALEDYNMYPVDVDDFYDSLSALGYNYSHSFRTFSSAKRRLGHSVGHIESYAYDDPASAYLVHPSTLDVAFQAGNLAYSAPSDNQLWSLHIPTSIGSIRLNPEVCASFPSSGSRVPVCSALKNISESFSASIELFSEDGQYGMIQVEDLAVKPFAPATEADDRVVFTHMEFDFAVPDGAAITAGKVPSHAEVDVANICERLCYYYLRQWDSQLTEDDWRDAEPHFLHLRNWIEHTLGVVSSGKHLTVQKGWSEDTAEDIKTLIKGFENMPDIKIIAAVGENMSALIRRETTVSELMIRDNILDNYYKQSAGVDEPDGFLADRMKQILHRYPRAKILEIGAGTGDSTNALLESIGGTVSSYTLTDPSRGVLDEAEIRFKAFGSKMMFKTLDIEKSPESQGFAPGTYDVVVAANALHATSSLQSTLTNARQLLKPGGFILLSELVNTGPLRNGGIFGGLSGWWLGVDEGRTLGPIASPREWHSALRQSGFSGIDTLTPEINPIVWPGSIIASQAVDEKVKFLRRPLFLSSSPVAVRIERLVIFGTQTLETVRLAEELSEYLEPFCDEVIILDSLPTDAEALALSPMSTFINLTDLDSPILEDLSEEKAEGLKRVLELAKYILWITHDALVSQPYHMASIALGRALSAESAHISLNQLDVSDLHNPHIAKAIAEHVLRGSALNTWEADPQNEQELLWSTEREVFLEGERVKIPRFIRNADQNDRLNCSRREITSQVSLSESNICIEFADDSSPPTLVDLGRANPGQARQDVIRVKSSTSMALRVIPDTFLFLAVAHESSEERPLLLLSKTNSHEVSPVVSVPAFTNKVTVQPEDQPEDPSKDQSENQSENQSGKELLIAVASELIAGTLIEFLPSHSDALVLCSGKDRVLAAALSRHAASKKIRVAFACDADSIDQQDSNWIKLTSRASQHTLRRKLAPFGRAHFLDLTNVSNPSQTDSPLTTRILRALPFKRIDPSTFTRQQPLFSSHEQESLIARLQNAVSAVKSSLGSVGGQAQDLAIRLDQIHDPAISYHANSVIDWPSAGLVEAHIRPLDCRKFFSKDRTYLLVGLSGMIGQSLCEWMVSNGAGCVCLTSRRPRVDERWMQSFHGTGATVRAIPMDVTNKDSVDSAVRDIRANCPPIAGVAHGAMVLHDALFSRMPASQMQEVLGPKIDGANNLEAAFYNDALDFFVMCSSVSSAVGNAGQSLYSAGNGYLNGLARKRRRRGLAASTLDIGWVGGVGYVETAGQAVRDQLAGLGLEPLSELDLRQAFAETIQAGFPTPDDQITLPEAVVTTGVRHFREDESIKGPWFTNPIFSHCIVEKGNSESDSGDQNQASRLPVSQQILKATSEDHVKDILLDCFCAKLRFILQLGDRPIDRDVSILDLGIDSLVAVEVRSWFLKELKVDIPVLKVLGGASPAELCQKAQEKLPEEWLTNVGKQNADSVKVSKPASGSQSPDSSKSKQSRPSPDPTMASKETPASGVSKISVFSPDSPRSLGTPSSTGLATPDESVLDLKDSSLQLNTPIKPQSVKELLPPPGERPSSQKFIKSAPLSFGQSRFWFLQQLLEDQRTHNVAFCFHVAGNLRVRDLEKAVHTVTTRHESLRTYFVSGESDAAEASQRVLSSSAIRLQSKRIHSIDEVATQFSDLRMQPLDLGSGQLLKLVLLTLSPTSHYLLICHHHIIMDGVSLQVFLSDLEKAYTSKPLGPVPRQYPDHSIAQRQSYEKGEMVDELNYWKRVFPAGGQPPVLPLLPMARISSRVPMTEFDTHQVEMELEPELVRRIRVASKAQRSTPFHFYLATFKAMLFALTDTDDLTIGVADAARHDSDVMDSIGFFLNLLPLRFHRQGDQKFGDAIVEARKTSYAALENSRLPFDVLLSELGVARDSSHSPFFQAFIDYRQGAQARYPLGNCEMEFQQIITGKTAYDITIDVTDTAEVSLLMLRAQKGLYDLTATNLLLETYVHFMDTLTRDMSLVQSSIPVFSEKQRSQAIRLGCGPPLVSDWPETLPHRIDQVAQENGDKVALMDGNDNSLTYSAMLTRIQVISEALQSVGVSDGSRVLVFQQATVDWVCSMLAIMRIGGVYVPLDLRNPMPRLAVVAQDSSPRAILADTTTSPNFPQLGVTSTHMVDVSALRTGTSRPIANIARSDSPAAILYTSGSTGSPKGIVVKHSGLRNEIEGYTKTWGLRAERVLQQSAFTFNHSSDQIYTGLANGGMVYIVPWSKRGSPIEITEIIKKHAITYTKATPSEYLLWMQYGGKNLRQASNWRFAFGGGENMPASITQEFANLGLSQLRLFNSYGPTEISISSTKMEIPYRETETLQKMGRIPCGYSLPNYNAYVLDEQLRPVPVGMPGELCIGGAGVSLGYFNNKKLTDAQFVPCPFASPEDVSKGWTTMYRTSDIVHLNEDGAMVFHNRMAGDTQVKIRGLRIELSDIESNIVASAGGALSDAVVTLREGDPEFLVAHVVFAPHQDVGDDDAFLARLLSNIPVPQYMVPVVAVPLDKLPLTNHSKVDRKAIKNLPLPKRVERAGEEAQLTDTMVQLKDIWRDVLGKSIETLGFDVTPSTDFFLIGGNSLLIIRVQAAIRRVFNVAIPLVELLGVTTLESMARRLEEACTVKLNDWEEETIPPSLPVFLNDVKTTRTDQGKAKTVLVTGGTGYLSKHLLPQLDFSPDVRKIHCVAVREKTLQNPQKLWKSEKVVHHRGDLSLPLLGLSEDEFRTLASEVDVILHMGSAYSFWDNYNVLRPSNVLSTKELVKLAAPRHIPIHYISTISVLPQGATLDAVSAVNYIPAADGSNGYASTRWVSERILERSQQALGVPSFIYRFLPSSRQGPLPKHFLNEILRFVDVTGTIPDTNGWAGHIDMVPAEQAGQWLCAAVLEGQPSDAGTQFMHYESPLGITTAQLAAHIERHRGDSALEKLSVVKWFTRIKANGFGYLLASHEATVGGGSDEGEGGMFLSRR